MSTSYEWDVEEIDEHGDIIDHNHHETAEEMVADYLSRPAGCAEMVLVRDVFNDLHGLLDRKWAYVDQETMTLDEWCADCSGSGSKKTPKRYLWEFTGAVESHRAELEKRKKGGE